MAIDLVPLPLPPSADGSKFVDFGREVKGVNPGNFTPEEFKELEEALYKVRLTISMLASAWVELDTARCPPVPQCYFDSRTAICAGQGKFCMQPIITVD
jgi:hypothetical protein